MSDRQTDYLAWAREKAATLHGGSGPANLFSSAALEPRAMLLDDLHALGLAGLLGRVDAPMEWGHPALLDGLRGHYRLPADRDLLITSSGSMAFVIAALAFTRPGDHAVVETPVYQPFLNVLHERGVQTSALPRPAPDFQLDPGQLEAALTPQTRLIVLTNLHNPSGALLADDTLREIAGLAARQGCMVVVDEVYRDMTPTGGAHPRPSALLAKNIVTISSLSKAYGLGRLRVGWIIAGAAHSARLREVHVSFDNSRSGLDQAIASRVVEALPRYRQHGQAAAAANRPALEQFAAEMIAAGRLRGEVPAQGCTYFPAVCGLEDTTAWVETLEREYGVVVVPGHFFAAPGHIRVSFGGGPDNLRAGLERLRAALLTR